MPRLGMIKGRTPNTDGPTKYRRGGCKLGFGTVRNGRRKATKAGSMSREDPVTTLEGPLCLGVIEVAPGQTNKEPAEGFIFLDGGEADAMGCESLIEFHRLVEL